MAPIGPTTASRFGELLGRLASLELAARTVDDWLALADLYAQAEVLDPLDHRLAANRGNALWLADRAEEAQRAYWRAAQLAPGDAVVLRGLGNVQLDLNAFEQAERAYGRSLLLEADARTAWNLSQTLIGLERYGEGYGEAERRWELSDYQAWREPFQDWPSGMDCLRESLLVWSEQGLGDTLQHLRWIGPLLLQRGASAEPLVLEVEPCLVVLLQQALTMASPSITVRAKPEEGPEPWPGRHLSLLSLPWLLGEAPLPPASSWLACPSWTPARSWPPANPRVGLVWATGRKLTESVTAREYHRRSLDSLALGQLLEGLHRRGVSVSLLQFGDDRSQADPWRHLITDTLTDDADFAATAARVAQLDLVISVDTAMAHLVGAMQRRGWMLLPWAAAPRWLRQRQDTPWYPSLRLFRQQQAGDWLGPVNAVLQQLDRELG